MTGGSRGQGPRSDAHILTSDGIHWCKLPYLHEGRYYHTQEKQWTRVNQCLIFLLMAMKMGVSKLLFWGCPTGVIKIEKDQQSTRCKLT